MKNYLNAKRFNYNNYEYLVRAENGIKIKVKNNKLVSQIYSDINESSLRIIKDEKMIFSYATGNLNVQDLLQSCNNLHSLGRFQNNIYFNSLSTHEVYCKSENNNDIISYDKALEQTFALYNIIFQYDANLKDIEIETRMYNYDTYLEGDHYLKHYKQNKSCIFLKSKTNRNIFREELNSFFEFDKIYKYLHKFQLKPCNINKNKNYLFIFDPKIVRDLILPIWKLYVYALSGKNIDLKLINLLSDNIRIFDNPCNLNSKAYMPFDHTGKNTCEEVIFDKAKSENIFKYKSAYCNVFKNNMFSRNFDISALPHKYPSILTMNKGNIDYENFIKNVSNGIYITESSNLWQNISREGFFKGIIDEGIIIHNGKYEGIIKGQTYSGNIFDVMGKDLIGHSSNFVQIGYYMDELPYLFCRNIKI